MSAVSEVSDVSEVSEVSDVEEVSPVDSDGSGVLSEGSVSSVSSVSYVFSVFVVFFVFFFFVVSSFFAHPASDSTMAKDRRTAIQRFIHASLDSSDRFFSYNRKSTIFRSKSKIIVIPQKPPGTVLFRKYVAGYPQDIGKRTGAKRSARNIVILFGTIMVCKRGQMGIYC